MFWFPAFSVGKLGLFILVKYLRVHYRSNEKSLHTNFRIAVGQVFAVDLASLRKLLEEFKGVALFSVGQVMAKSEGRNLLTFIKKLCFDFWTRIIQTNSRERRSKFG